jgi:release factor glutamine methyltransferase
MKIQELLQYGNQSLADAGIEDAALDARYLLEWVMECSHAYLLLHGMEDVTPAQLQRYQDVIHQRSQHMPVQYITQEQEFMGYPFYVNEHVLIPRQDTEVLVEAVIHHIETSIENKQNGAVRILDLCCGSGCIGISLKKQLQARAIDTALTLSDISKEALAVAQRNADVLQCEATFVESDLFTQVSGRYSVIVSNPPYIPSRVVDTLMPEVREHEPRLALDGEADGLSFYRRIIHEAADYLEDEGYVFFEIGFNQAEDIRKILVDAGFDKITVLQDLAGLNRVVAAHRCEE